MTLPTFGPHLLAGILTNNPSFTTMDTAIALKASLEPYFITCVPCILLSIMTVSLNIFVINYYRKTKFTLVPLLYTMISGVDIRTAVGVIHQSIAISLFTGDVISETSLDLNTVVCFTLIQVSYRSSVFYNLVLAVSRTVVILRPFHRIKIKTVMMICFLYVLPWIVIAGSDVYQIYFVERKFTQGFYIAYIVAGSGLAQIVATPGSMSWYGVLVTLLVLAFVIPVVTIIITCVIQVVSLHRPDQFPASSNQSHVTVTVILMSTLFIVCNSGLYVFLFSILFGLEYSPETFTICITVFSTVLPIVNTALNPVIIISRSKGLRRRFAATSRRLTGQGRTSVTET